MNSARRWSARSVWRDRRKDDVVNQINLIPAPRREAKVRRTRLVRWGIVLGLYVGALLGAHFVCGACWSGDRDLLAAETRESAARLREANRLTLSLHGEMTRTEEKLRSAQAVGRQPDWGVLLGLLARNVDDDVVLEFCRLRQSDRPRSGKGASAAARLDQPLVLDLGGLAMSQAVVSRFVLRLEKTGLFDQVRLVNTNQREFLKKDAVVFRLECLLSGQGGAT